MYVYVVIFMVWINYLLGKLIRIILLYNVYKFEWACVLSILQLGSSRRLKRFIYVHIVLFFPYMPTKLMLEFSVNTCTNIFINSHKTSLTPSQLIPFYCFKRVFKAKLSVKKFLLLTVKCFLFTYIEVFKDAFVFCCFRLKLISFLGSLFITLALS